MQSSHGSYGIWNWSLELSGWHNKSREVRQFNVHLSSCLGVSSEHQEPTDCGTVKYYILYNTDKLSYCWWFRNPSITSWYGKCPIIFRILYTCMGKPPVSEKSLQVLWASVGHNVPHETFWEPGNFCLEGFLDRWERFWRFFWGEVMIFFFWGGEGRRWSQKNMMLFFRKRWKIPSFCVGEMLALGCKKFGKKKR